jgi:AraC-like DNA-binding protein
MDKIDQAKPGELLSQQVGRGRYFFLNLAEPSRSPATLVFGGREECNPDYAIRRSSFPYYVLELVESGEGTVRLGAAAHPLRPGSVFAYAPTTPCEIRTDPKRPLRKFFLAFRRRTAAKWFAELGVPIAATRQLATPAEAIDACAEIVREGQKPGPFTTAICETLVALLSLKIREALAAPPSREPAREAFLRCKAIIDAEPDRVLTLREVADAAGVDMSTVCRWFRRFQGISPYQYLLRRKMNLAAQFLIQNGGMVKEAAVRVGFDDPYHFSRVFKAVHGVPPSALWARERD